MNIQRLSVRDVRLSPISTCARDPTISSDVEMTLPLPHLDELWDILEEIRHDGMTGGLD